MRLHLRFLTLVMVCFLCFVSYKIIEPELSSEPPQLHHRRPPIKENYGSKGLLPDRLQEADFPEERISALLDLYQLNWKYPMNDNEVWSTAANWVTSREVHPEETPALGLYS